MADQLRFDAIAQEMARRSSGSRFVLLDRDLRIRAASAAYERVTLHEPGELAGQFMFDAFPDDPGDPHATGKRNLEVALQAVLRSGRGHKMRIQRYDLRDPTDPDTFVPKVWNPNNSPVIDHGELVGVVHRVEEISTSAQLLAEVAHAVDHAGSWTRAELLHTFAAITAGENARQAQRQQELIAENEQLRRAIETRDTIGQVKGILMERFHVDADEAFKLLVKVSQNANVPVEQIARKLLEIDHPTAAS